MSILKTHHIEFEPVSGEAWEFIARAILIQLKKVKLTRQAATEGYNIANTITAHLQKVAAGVPVPKRKKKKQRAAPVDEIDPYMA